MKIFVVLAFAVTCVQAQSELKFDKPSKLCEDRWVASLTDSADGSYTYGFIYLDKKAGFTIDVKGAFKILPSGAYVTVPSAFKEMKGSVKMRLKPDRGTFAIIPTNKLTELGVPPEPIWLKIYREDTVEVKDLYDWGFTYNAYELCSKALRYLEKAYSLEPKYKGLEVELGYSYNCLEHYAKAAVILQAAYETDQTNAYINKELIYSQLKAGQLDLGAESCKRALIVCKDTTHNAENSYNVLYEFYLKKDIQNFDAWKPAAKRWNSANKDRIYSIGIMEIDLKK
ncbi:MAG: hypothetical protein SGJ05_06775 [bacterium]|nr:hypothetical protein [bacterium]